MKDLITTFSRFLFILPLSLLFFSCNNQPKQLENKTFNTEKDSLGHALFEQKCQVCHNLGDSEENIIAPPFFAVRRQYMRFSMDKEDFKQSMLAYVLNPNQENSLMKPAVEKFGVMPKQVFDEKELDIIIDYIYQHEISKPSWFDSHDAMHKKGIKHSH